MGYEAPHRVSVTLLPSIVKKLNKEKEVPVVLSARRHNYPLLTIFKINKKTFATVYSKKPLKLISKNGKTELGFKYVLVADLKKEKRGKLNV